MANGAADTKPREEAGSSVPIHYFTGVNNVGDLLNPFLVSKLFGVSTHLAVSRDLPHLIAIGSFLHEANSHSHIWGTGAISPTWEIPALDVENVYALRGKLSHALLKSRGLSLRDVPLGDPGFLVASLKDGFAVDKKYRLGVSAHYFDRSHPWVQKLLADPSVLDLNVHRPPDEYLKDASACEVVVSSSLHGLIIAEALGIPNIWIKLSDDVIGDGFKFRDWYSLAERPQNEPELPMEGKAADVIADLASKAMLHEVRIDVDQLIGVLPFEKVRCPKPVRFRDASPLANIRGLNSQFLNVSKINRPQQLVDAWVSEGVKTQDGGLTLRRTNARVPLFGSPVGSKAPVVSCLMVTANRPAQARVAIECYRRQSWPNRKLIILDSGTDDAIERWLKTIDDRSINYKRVVRGTMTLGDIRNVAIQRVRGDYVCNWDDDDLHHPFRIEAQIAAMEKSRTEACMLSRLMIWWPFRSALVVSASKFWEGTLVAKVEAMPRYPSWNKSEDVHAIQTLQGKSRVVYVDAPELYVYVKHQNNTWGDAHFETMRRRATEHFPAGEYDGVVARLRNIFPIDDYMDAIRL